MKVYVVFYNGSPIHAFKDKYTAHTWLASEVQGRTDVESFSIEAYVPV